MAAIDPPKFDEPVENWLVYADALQSAGDPRGELIVLNKAVADGGSPKDRDVHLDRHEAALFGSLAPHRGVLAIEWRHCVPEVLTLQVDPGVDAAALVDATLRSPLGAAMQRLRLVGRTPTESDRVALAPAVAILADRLPKNCVSLDIVDERAANARILVSSDYDPGPNLVEFGALSDIFRIAHLESLRLHVADTRQVELGTIDAPSLRHFALLGLRWAEPYAETTPMGEILAAAKWPSLESLHLRIPETVTYSWPVQDGAYVRVDCYDEENDEYEGDEGWNDGVTWGTELRGLLGNLARTSIRRLSLTSFASSRSLLEALAEHGLPPSLQELDLSASDLTDDDVAWIVEHASVFSRLKRLDLRDTLIDDPSRLSTLGPEILHSRGGGSIYEFSVGME